MRAFSAILILVVAAWATACARAEDPAHLWRLCAESELIVSGTITVPVGKTGQLEKDSSGYTSVLVRIEQTLKGKMQATLSVRHYEEDDKYQVPNQVLVALDGQRAVLFLISASTDGVTRQWYLAGYREGLKGYSSELVQSVSSEVQRQQAVLLNWKPHSKNEDRKAVKFLVDRMVDPEAEASAFKTLESLGQPYIPAIIDLMDDRRELAIKQISLRNYAPNRFEEFRHYGPKLIIDALAAILNQITGESFDFIYNGATDDERAREVAGWRVYQDVLLNHRDWLKAN